MRVRLPLTVIPVAVFIAIGGLLMASGPSETVFGAGYIDRPLPDFTQPALQTGATGLTKSDFAGQVALIHVFASWCSTCRAEHPLLMQLANSTDTPIYGLNWRDRKGAALVYLDRFGDPYRATATDSDGELGARIGVTGVPETLVIDTTGRIRYRHIGPISQDLWRSVLLPLMHELEAAS